MTEKKKYRALVAAAIAVALLFLGLIVDDHFSQFGPGDLDTARGDNQFKSGKYRAARKSYQTALIAWPDHAGAYIGLANSFTQLGRYEDALRAVERSIELEPEFGGYFATRGIVLDHLGRHRDAMVDYEKALRLYPDAGRSMPWLDRFFRKIAKAPPTIKERLKYLRGEFKKPEGARVLRIHELDARQRPYQR